MRLLVVDDDVAVRMTLSMALVGVDVVEAWRGNGAVSDTVDAQADAVVLDRRLPDGDGLDAVRALRADERTADVPIVVVTASDDPVERTLAFRAGADEHVVKPLDPERLLALVERIVATPAADRQVRRTLRRARLHVGRDDGGHADLLPPTPAPATPAKQGRRWRRSRSS
jgi:DNA-binding response OmpR family regulator